MGEQNLRQSQQTKKSDFPLGKGGFLSSNASDPADNGFTEAQQGRGQEGTGEGDAGKVNAGGHHHELHVQTGCSPAFLMFLHFAFRLLTLEALLVLAESRLKPL